MLASTFFDLVVGLDIHFEMVPPAMVPTPFPHPFIGMVFDPAGLVTNLIVSNVIDMAKAGELTPPKGPVLINGMPATNTGTNVVNKMVLPHFVIPPGTMWTPMPKAPKPKIGLHAAGGPDSPVAPAGDAVLMMGSKTVLLMGSNAVRMGDLAMSCSEPIRMPSSSVIAIPKGAPVIIGGPPAIDWQQAVGALLRSKWIANEMHGLVSRLKNARLRSLLTKAVCFFTGHPVDVATGRMMTWATDWKLPGPIPLVFERNYDSSWSGRDGVLGFGWSHTLDQAVWTERGRVVYRADDGREVEFDTFHFDDHVMQAGDSAWEPISRLTLRCQGGGRWEIESAGDGLVREFDGVPGDSRRGLSRLARIRSRTGHAIRFLYDAKARLDVAHDSGGRVVRFEHDSAGRLARVWLPDPSRDGWLQHTEYRYSAEGDLLAVVDSAGHAMRFEYAGRLMVKETDRNGLSFYFGYDGTSADAKCIRTWGDGGLYDHEIAYDTANRVTIVTNSLGHTTVYYANAVGAVTRVVDPGGATESFEYDERSLRQTKRTDALGAETAWSYDPRGNLVTIVDPSGATFRLAYNERDQIVAAVTPTDDASRWEYDERGLLMARVDALGGRTAFRWDGGMIVAVRDSAGRVTTDTHDSANNLVARRLADGAELRWTYDRRGRLVKAVDPAGGIRTLEYDDAGRPSRVTAPDRSVRRFAYDPQGNLVRLTEGARDLELAYQGVGRLSYRREGGLTLRFEYDSEEHLTGVVNEVGLSYRFEHDPAGRPSAEVNFDGRRSAYARDGAGRVIRLKRPSGSESEFAYDDCGRLVEAKHADGGRETYRYRPDGALVEATNGAATVTLRRDVLGRIVREEMGDDWVASEFDARGLRTRIWSSRRLDHRIDRDVLGRAVGSRASTVSSDGLAAAAWESQIKRDASGMEVERVLPGGVKSRWERDIGGRVVKSEVFVDGGFSRAMQYAWGSNDSLQRVVDAMRGPSLYEQDVHGNLAGAVYESGEADLRMPDAVGNLFRTRDRSDRTYGASGQLLETRGTTGTTTYRYDGDGRLVEKRDGKARVWTYAWSAPGMLLAVNRPDGQTVSFTYDAFGRRLSKTCGPRTTRWLWDGNVPLHEWVVRIAAAPAPAMAVPEADPAIAERQRKALLQPQLTQGPPRSTRTPRAAPEGSADAPITWLFVPETFVPVAKLVGSERYSIVSDPFGTPVAMYDGEGQQVWSTTLDVYGVPREGPQTQACPFRWPGQYEDVETGLYYNRFRYYDPESGQYTSEDPIRLAGGTALYAYVPDPTSQSDVFGLSCPVKDDRVGPKSHLEMFRDGATVFLPESVWNWLKANKTHLGYESGLFMTTRAEADRIAASGDRALLKKRLGIPPQDWNGPIVRVDIPDALEHNPRMPAGYEEGANPLWRPGGYTKGGAPELVTDPVPLGDVAPPTPTPFR